MGRSQLPRGVQGKTFQIPVPIELRTILTSRHSRWGLNLEMENKGPPRTWALSLGFRPGPSLFSRMGSHFKQIPLLTKDHFSQYQCLGKCLCCTCVSGPDGVQALLFIPPAQHG